MCIHTAIRFVWLLIGSANFFKKNLQIISRSTGPAAVNALLPHLSEVLVLLFENTDKEEEGIRTVVAKCLGKFTMISPQQLLPALQKGITDESPQVLLSYLFIIIIVFCYSIYPGRPAICPTVWVYFFLLISHWSGTKQSGRQRDICCILLYIFMTRC